VELEKETFTLRPNINARGPLYHQDPKPSNIYTPAPLANFLFDLLAGQNFNTVLDPGIGTGALTKPWRASGRMILGCDINPASKASADVFLEGLFEQIKQWSHPMPDVALCNPPWNGAGGKGLYPEIFLRHLVQLFGKELPIALFCPMGLRLNQRLRSPRSQWLRDSGPRITDIIALPLDIFPRVQHQAELILFNLPDIEHHTFLPQRYINQMLQDEVCVNLRTGRYYIAGQKQAHRLKDAQVMTEAAAIEAGYSYAYKR
jgi:hypothetical protein